MYATLLNLHNTSDHIEASAIISVDGLVITSMLPKIMNEDPVGAIIAAIMSVAKMGIQSCSRGELEQILVQGTRGQLIITRAGEEAILVVMIKPDIKLDTILLNVKRSAKRIQLLG